VKRLSEREKLSVYRLLEESIISELNNVCTNEEISLKLFVPILWSKASGEKSFLVLKKVKNY